MLAQGAEQIQAGDFEAARQSFQQVLELDPDSGQAYAQIGDTYYREDSDDAGNIEKAVYNANKAIEKDANLAMPHEVLARIYDTAWDRRTLMAFAGCLGVGIVARLLAGFGIRQVVKLIPVYGQTAGAAAAAASSFATTYALGQAAIAFLAGGRAGKVDADAVTRAYREALTKAFDIERHKGMAGSDRGATQDAS